MLLGDARRFLAALAYCFWCRLADTRIAKLFVQSFIQGLSAGGQIGGTISLLMEHAAEEKRREFLAWQQASVGAFYLLAGAIG